MTSEEVFNEKKYLKEVKKHDVFQKQYLEAIGLLLLSIRGDWGDAKSVKTRAKAALCLIDLINKNCLFESEKFVSLLSLEQDKSRKRNESNMMPLNSIVN